MHWYVAILDVDVQGHSLPMGLGLLKERMIVPTYDNG